MLDNYVRNAKLHRVIDGDTFWLFVDLGYYSVSAVKVRLRGIDCPELNTDKGRAAKAFVEKTLGEAGAITIMSFKDEHSFDRWVCDVYVDDRPLAQLLREAGHEKGVP